MLVFRYQDGHPQGNGQENYIPFELPTLLQDRLSALHFQYYMPSFLKSANFTSAFFTSAQFTAYTSKSSLVNILFSAFLPSQYFPLHICNTMIYFHYQETSLDVNCCDIHVKYTVTIFLFPLEPKCQWVAGERRLFSQCRVLFFSIKRVHPFFERIVAICHCESPSVLLQSFFSILITQFCQDRLSISSLCGKSLANTINTIVLELKFYWCEIYLHWQEY